MLTLARVAGVVGECPQLGATLVFDLEFVGLVGEDRAQFLAVVVAIGIDQDFRVAFIDADSALAAVLLGFDFHVIVNFDALIVFDDNAQGAGRLNGGVEWNGDALTFHQAGNFDPGTPTELKGGVVVRAHDNLVVRVIVTMLPVLAHHSAQIRIVYPVVAFECGEQAFLFGLILGMTRDAAARFDLGRFHVSRDVALGIA